MDTERGVLHRYPVAQFARTRPPGHLPRFSQDADPGPEESGEPEAGPDARVEPESPAAAEPRRAAHLGIRVPLADQHEPVSVVGAQQGAEHTHSGPDAGPSAHAGQELHQEPVQRRRPGQRSAQHVRHVQSGAVEAGEQVDGGHPEPSTGQRSESVRGHGIVIAKPNRANCHNPMNETSTMFLFYLFNAEDVMRVHSGGRDILRRVE